MSRYAEALGEVVRRIQREQRGWCLVQCVSGEQPEVASCLGQMLQLPVAAISDELEGFSECVIALTPGMSPAKRDAALASINGRRDRLSDRGRWILVVSRLELLPLQRYAADIFSVLKVVEVIPLVPRQINEAETSAARRQLAAWFAERFGRLDLRGFVRSEGEDVSFPVEEIFQPLEAVPSPLGRQQLERDDEHLVVAANPITARSDASSDFNDEPVLASYQRPAKPLFELVSAANRPVLILGSPGAGKSFFLRWCALKACEPAESTLPFFGVANTIPVLIPLSAVGLMPGQPSLEEYAVEVLLAEGLDVGHLLSTAAGEGRALFLLDGLDEAGDVAARRASWSSVVALAQRFPSSRFIVTSRPGGLDDLDVAEQVTREFETLSISPLSDTTIRTLLTRWCELYELQREGTEAARARGRENGEALAAQVLTSPPVRELASSPLLATVVAIIHRAGVRLPDRRVELYEHALKILVERWNRVRSRNGGDTTPLRLTDAIRLLGPVALEIINREREGAIDEEALEGMLRRSLAAGNIRGLSDAAAAIDLFRDSLGLLVERAPGVYGFLHQTFVEFLAAHELLRTDKLLPLVKSPRHAYDPKWHEVILLGAGILGVLQANDEELDAVVASLISSAKRRKGRPSTEVPRLLSALLADDPSLSTKSAQLVAETLIPTWWFERKYGRFGSQQVMQDAYRVIPRIRSGSWDSLVRSQFDDSYTKKIFWDRIEGEDGDFISYLMKQQSLIGLLRDLDLEAAPLICSLFFRHSEQFGIRGDTSIESCLWRRELRVELSSQGRSRRIGGAPLTEGMKTFWTETKETGLWMLDTFSSPYGYRGWPQLVKMQLSGDALEVIYKVSGDVGVTPSLGFWSHCPGVNRESAADAVLRAWRKLSVMFPDAPAPPGSRDGEDPS